MKKSIAARLFIPVLGAILLFGTAASFAEEATTGSAWSTAADAQPVTGEVTASEWSTPAKASAASEKDYELVVIEQEKVPLAEGPVALEKSCILHVVLFGTALLMFFVLRGAARKIEADNRELELRIGIR